MDNVCATEPNDANGLSPFDLPEDGGDELLTVNLSPAGKARKRSKSFRLERNSQLVNQNTNATDQVKATPSGRITTGGVIRNSAGLNSKLQPN